MDFDVPSKFVKNFCLSIHQRLDEFTEQEAICAFALGDARFDGATFPESGGLGWEITQRFMAKPQLVPINWYECVIAAKYWSELITLRRSRNVGTEWENIGLAHQQFCMEQLAEAEIKDADEAITIIEHLETDAKLMAHPDMGAVMKNLAVFPRAHQR